MRNQALVIIDIQNDITRHYRDIIDNINQAVAWAVRNQVHVVYFRHENLSAGTRTFKPDTHGAELAADLNIVSGNIFTKHKGSILTCEAFVDFIRANGIDSFHIAGADAVACVKASCYNLRKAGYHVSVLSDCITSYDKSKIEGMLCYYANNGCNIIGLHDL